jgi:hypothetical protein
MTTCWVMLKLMMLIKNSDEFKSREFLAKSILNHKDVTERFATRRICYRLILCVLLDLCGLNCLCIQA